MNDNHVLPRESSRKPGAGLPPRRTLNRLAWALLGLGLAWIAQRLLQSNHLWEGILLYATAITLFAIALAPALFKPKHPPQIDPPQAAGKQSKATGLGSASRLRSWTGWALVLAGLALSLESLFIFAGEARGGIAWLFYLGSLVLFLAGIHCLEPAQNNTSSAKSPVRRAFFIDPWLLLILLLAAIFRLYLFDSLPFGTWYDEAVAGIDARRILQDPSFRPAFWDSMNHPAHHLYLFALAMKMLGDSVLSMRLVSVLFGLGAVVSAYLFGNELQGRRWALLLAFLVASMRWNVNFSRIAMNGIDVPFFAFLTLYFGLRAVRTRLHSWRAMAATGVTLGLGLCFYTGFRLFAFTFVLFGLGVLWWACWPGRQNSEGSKRWVVDCLISGGTGRRQLLLGLGVLVISTWLAVMPIAQFGWRHSDVFWQRTQTVSIFTHRDEPSLPRALAHNVQKHLLMFNYRGDINGRHNLPGAPTLDQLSAVLFALGLGLALARRDRASLFFLLLFPVGLAGGILSLDFEAPQSLRSIASMPAVIYFIALSLDGLWVEAYWAFHKTRPGYLLAPALLGLGLIAASNGLTYFGTQARDAAVWRAFSVAETLVGKYVAQSGPEPIYYFSPFFSNHVDVRFHAPQESPDEVRKLMPLPDALPARELADRPVVYFIHPDEVWVFDWARRLYPKAQFEVLPPDPSYPPMAYVVRLSPEDVASVQGLDVRYWQDEPGQGTPIATGRSPMIDFAWPQDAPQSPPFAAQWEGVLYAPQYGHYQLSFLAPGDLEVKLDGESHQATGQLVLDTLLAEGNHSLQLTANGGQGHVRLAWQMPDGEMNTVPVWALYSTPVTNNGLLGRYYSNPDWIGDPTLERVDPTLNMYFHLTPLPRPYSAEWTGALEIPAGDAGEFGLGLRAVSRAQLYLDDVLVVDASQPDEYTQQSVPLAPGLHNLSLRYQDVNDRSRIHLYWMPPGREMEIIPSGYLWPSTASAGASSRPAPALAPKTQLEPMDLVWLSSWGEMGSGPGQFLEARDVAVIEDIVFVADTGNQRVQSFDRSGTYLAEWRGADDSFEEPLALGVDSSKRLLVLDSLQGWIYRFDAAGNPLDRIAGPVSQTFHPRGLTVLPDDTIVVADTGGARLLFFNSAGTTVGQLGELGDAPGQFNEPTDMALAESGVYYVLEAYNERMQKIDVWGGSLGTWPISPSVAYDGPHMAWAPDGSLLVTAPGDGSVRRYSPDGQMLNQWTRAGDQSLQRPVGIHVDHSGTVFITDTATHQVHVFSIEQP